MQRPGVEARKSLLLQGKDGSPEADGIILGYKENSSEPFTFGANESSDEKDFKSKVRLPFLLHTCTQILFSTLLLWTHTYKAQPLYGVVCIHDI